MSFSEHTRDIAIEEIYLPSKNSKDTYLCEDFIIYPEGKEKNGGYLFGIIEARATPLAEGEKIIQAIINNLKAHYYQQINASPEPQKLNLETVFEYALQKTNAAITEMIQIGHIKISFENLHYAVGIAKPRMETKDISIVIAQQGLISVYLLHKTKQNNYKVINIVENTPRAKDEPPEKIKLFSSTVSGQIYQHNTLYVCTEIFNNYIPAYKVNKVLAGNALSVSTDYFKALINNVKNNSPLTYSAIFIKLGERKQAGDKALSEESINKLILTKENTEKFLTPSFSFNLKINWQRLLGGWRGKSKKTSGPHGPALPPNVRSRPNAIRYLAIAVKGIGNWLLEKSISIGRIINGKKKLTLPSLRKAHLLPKTIIIRSTEQLSRLSARNRHILLAIFALAIILVSSIFWIQHRREIKLGQANYGAELNRAKDFINNAQINLIYKDEEQSLKLIKSAEGIVIYLPQATNNQKANKEELQKQIETIKNKLLHIEKSTPQMLAEIKSGEQAVKIIGLAKNKQTIGLQTAQNSLYQFNEASQNLSAALVSEFGDLIIGAGEDARQLYITNQNKLVELKPAENGKNKLFPLSVAWGDVIIEDALLYNKSLYILDSKNQQVYKFKSEKDGFSGRQAWIKESTNKFTAPVRAMAVDGNVYIATEDGKVYKLYTGAFREFALKTIEPALNAIKKIFTSTELDYFYILDSIGNRICVFDKNGNFVKQYLIESLSADIADIFVDAEKIFLVSDNKLYSIQR